ncbi:MAG TPA: RnfABCDGE type electron transport complex subunit D [Candidatus Nitrosotalea sp.]|nr:RnfABCDGE type electron transport complex subunit D [Candidatus Nitrosotalea sp.]
MRRALLAPLRRAAFEPQTLPAEVVAGLALVAPVVAGLAIFRLPALILLALGLVLGGAAMAVALWLRLPHPARPLISALFAVALIGPGAPLVWVCGAAAGAAMLALAAVWLLPRDHAETGLWAAAAVLLLSRGAASAYYRPGSQLVASEPIRLWLSYFISLGQSPIDAVKLYVGNVPGPVFATSLLAVGVAAAWYWYARRLSLLVLLTFLVGALIPILVMHWPIRYQLDSGPLWFVAALILADRRHLPASRLGRPLLGLCAGLVATAARIRGYSIEAVVTEVAALQILVSLLEGGGWMVGNRRLVWETLRHFDAHSLSLRGGRRYRISSS